MSLQLAKSFSVDANIEKNYEKLKIDTFKLDENWLCSDMKVISNLLGRKIDKKA